jgi:hypothetical protein
VISAIESASISTNDLVLHATHVPTNESVLRFCARGQQSQPFGSLSLRDGS